MVQEKTIVMIPSLRIQVAQESPDRYHPVFIILFSLRQQKNPDMREAQVWNSDESNSQTK